MSIIIINSRNPTPKFISVFSAKNLTVNDAIGDTMLSGQESEVYTQPLLAYIRYTQMAQNQRARSYFSASALFSERLRSSPFS